jgi:hypothetical protein
MQQLSFDGNLLKKWIVLNGILWPVGLYLNWLLVYILFYGLGRSGIYSSCTPIIEIPSPTTPLHTSSLCLQGWFILEFCLAGIIVGKGIGFVQWRYALRHINLPKSWIDINTLSWAVGGPLAYLFYILFLRSLSFQFVPFLSQDIPNLTIFTWVYLFSKLISCVGEQRILSKHLPKPNYWLLSNLLGIGSAGVVDVFLLQWIPAILYIGLFVGVTSGLALVYCTKHSEESTFIPRAQL